MGKNARLSWLPLLVVLLMALGFVSNANAQPVSGLADSTALPTAQVTGIVWAAATRNDIVYATGRFTKARPSGVAAGGVGEVGRGNLLAFNITTGKLTEFKHTLNAEGKAITVSADGKTLFVGGLFTTVDGHTRNHLAAFSIATGALLPTYATGPSGKVLSLAAASNGKLYVGGAFSKVGTVARTNIAAYTTTGALDTIFIGKANSQVTALVVTPNGSAVVAGGSFSAVAGPTAPNGVPMHGLASFTTTDGSPVLNWAAGRDDFPIQSDDPATTSKAVTSLATDGEKVYGSAFNYNNAKIFGSWEGTFAISPTNGALVWANNCHGDTYDIWPQRGVLYSVSHAHDCTAVGAYPETTPPTWHRANASTTTVDGVNVCGAPPYWCNAGIPRSTMLLGFAPTLNTGPAAPVGSGAFQGAWTVTGNGSYVVLGGEFTKVNGAAQQGLTRMAIH